MSSDSIFRNLTYAALATAFMIAGAQAGSGTNPSGSPDSSSTAQAPLVTYRLYVKTQADSLVGMTKVLAQEIEDGNLEAAQSAYAPAHRYLARIAPVLRLMGDIERRMDAQVGAFSGRETDPGFSGFHRIEYGLFSQRSMRGLSEIAHRLLADARTLREQIAQLELNPDALVAQAAVTAEDSATQALTGDAERYAHTDLWDVEANVDGIREIVTLAQARGPGHAAASLDRATGPFASIDALLTKQKDGCGFKTYDTLTTDERMALKRPLLALAAALSLARGSAAID